MTTTSPEPIFSRPARGSRGPAPSHSRPEIVAAAIAVADSRGLPAMQMRAVAAALGTGAGSLYRYLSSRDDLLDLMTDEVVGELEPFAATSGDWLDDLVLLAGAQLALYRRHRWLVDALQRAAAPGPHTLAYFDHCLGVLAGLDCGTAAKFEAIAMMTGVVSLFARSEAAGPPRALDGVEPAMHPHLVAAIAEQSQARPAPARDLLDRALRGLLTGLLVE